MPFWRYDDAGVRVENITDWALKQFKDRYRLSATSAKTAVRNLSASMQPETLDSRFRGNDEDGSSAQSGGASRNRGLGADKRAITKLAIFHYVYAVLHDPLYREKYAQNLKREFPRIPFYADLWRWSEWGRELMALHIGYETIEAWPLTRIDTPDEKARKNGAAPKAMLKADKDNGRIALDSETVLVGVPAEAWSYKLGNRSALEWGLDQYKEKKPKDATIRAKFDTYRFADYKEKVIDLIARVTRVSVETQRIVEAMRVQSRWMRELTPASLSYTTRSKIVV